MDLVAQLRILEAAQGDPAKLALAAVDLTYPDLPEPERAALKEALEAAAIPHWFDEEILAALLEVPLDESAARLARLRGLKVVETFPARGEGAVNVHEASRLALRKHMFTGDEARFRALSGRAAALFEPDNKPSARIEWIYHLLCAEPERGASALEEMDRHWSDDARPEERFGLAMALRELEDSQALLGRARLWALLSIAWTRSSRGEEAQLAAAAQEALGLALELSIPLACADSLLLCGDCFEAQGNLTAAQAFYGDALRVVREALLDEPTSMVWERQEAIIHGRLGGVFEADGQLLKAQREYTEYLGASSRLSERDPTNPIWRRDLAAAHSRMGAVLEELGELELAEAAFGSFLSIAAELAMFDADNLARGRDLSVAHGWIGGIQMKQGKFQEALSHFRTSLAIMSDLVARDSTNLGWLHDLAVAQSCVGQVLEGQGKTAEAELIVRESYNSLVRLLELNPGHIDWQRDMASVLGRLGGLLQNQERFEEARSMFQAYLAATSHLASLHPMSVASQRSLARANWRLAGLEVAAGKAYQALPHYETALAIFESLVTRAPEFADWKKEKRELEKELAECQDSTRDAGNAKGTRS